MDQTVPFQPSLPFARSESRVVAARGGLVQTMQENGPRIVGGLKLLGDLAAAFSGNPFLMGYAAFSITGRIILLMYGSKEHGRQLAKEQRGKTDASQHGVGYKITHPRDYPIESSASLSVIGEALGGLYGFDLLNDGSPSGYGVIGLGILAVGMYANILFGKEKPKEAQQPSLQFASSKSQMVGSGVFQALKDNPVMTSSLIAVAISSAMVLNSILGAAAPFYIASTIIGLVANITQLLLVRKNDYNVEGAQEANKRQASEPRPTGFQERLAHERTNAAMQLGHA